jgi:1A family penicillin-binding protein
LIGLGVLFAWYAKDLPTPGRIQKRKAAEATQILDREGHPLYAVYDEEKRLSIPADQMPDILRQATVAIEDKDFYRHRGVDVRGIIRGVILKPLTGQRAQGGSTITQQYVKNALLTSERSIDRKIKELIIALELEFMYSKEEILTLYLNEIPYGSNVYGIEAAAQTFFGKSARDLNLTEATTLAALPQRPSYLSPYGSHTDELTERRNFVLERMAALGFIAEETKEASQAQTVSFVPRRETITAPHFVFYVRDKLIEKYGEQLVLEGGLKVTTTLDLRAQRKAEEAIATADNKYLTRYKADNAALVALDPRNGQILAMVGSVDYFDTDHGGNFNVTTALRQPGSAFKPIVYAAAFKGTLSPSSTLWDVETDFGQYRPQNYDGSQRGPVTVRSALANSLNIPAVKTLALTGLDKAIKTAQDLGITSLTEPDRYGLSLVLGGAEVKPLELAAAYGVFGAEGSYHEPSPILRVEDSSGKVLDEWQDVSREALAPEIAYQITHILIDNQARTPVFGARSPLYFPGMAVAAKTGTTQEYRDGWTVGYTPEVTTAVWVGNNDNSPMDQAGGVRAAGPIFHDFMVGFYENREAPGFPRPSTIREVEVDALSGKLPTEHSPQVIRDIFAPWQIPTTRDDVHVSLDVNRLNGQVATDLTPPDVIERRSYTRIHSERPSDPRWEEPVRAWAGGQGYNLDEPPTDKDDTSPAQLPAVTLSEPTNGSVLTKNFTISAEVAAPAGVRSVDFAIDSVVIGSRTEAPWSVAYDATKLSTGNHEILVQVTDQYGSLAQATVVVVVAEDQTPPGPATNVSAESAGLPSNATKLNWQNPTDSDLAKVRVYRSTTSGQLGSLVQEVNATPGSAGSTTIGGQVAGTTYYFTLRPVDAADNETPTTTPTSSSSL